MTKFLTTTHCHNHFQLVTIRELLCRKQAAWHDLAVALQRDAFAGQAHLFDEYSYAGRVWKLAGYAVDVDGNHF